MRDRAIKDKGKDFVFISYKTGEIDEERVNELAQFLEQRNVRYWVAPQSIPVGSNYEEEVMSALGRCSAVIMVLSERSQASRHVKTEITKAFGLKLPIFPIRIDDCQLLTSFEYNFQNVQVVDWSTENILTVIMQVKEAIRLGPEKYITRDEQKVFCNTTTVNLPAYKSKNNKIIPIIIAAVAVAILAIALAIVILLKDKPSNGDESTKTNTNNTTQATTEYVNPMIDIFSDSSLDLIVGDSYQLVSKVSKQVTWKTSDERIATVDSNGVVYALGDGTCTITGYVGDQYDVCTVNVRKKVQVLSINFTSSNILESESKQLEITGAPAEEVTWKTSKPDVATVDENGLVTGVKSGTCIITATVYGQELTCTVNISKINIILKSDYKAVYVNKTLQILATTNSINALVWTSSNPEIATVSQDGIVTGVSQGNVDIIVTIGNAQAVITIRVV